MIKFLSLPLILLLSVCGCRADFHLPEKSTQILLCLAPDETSSTGELTTWKKNQGTWQPALPKIPLRFGRDGLAWGRGLQPEQPAEKSKRESDWKTPMGVFEIGEAYGYAPTFPTPPGLKYIPVGPGHLWVEDPQSPFYNQYLCRTEQPLTAPWEKKAQMKLDDPAHSLKLFIRHNALPNIKPGAGSAIFFHIWRDDGARATSGCLVMARPNLETLIKSIRPGRHPLVVILTQADYTRLKPLWDLP